MRPLRAALLAMILGMIGTGLVAILTTSLTGGAGPAAVLFPEAFAARRATALLPPYPGARTVGWSSQRAPADPARRECATYAVTAPPPEVAAYYRAALARPGWMATDATGLRVQAPATGALVTVLIDRWADLGTGVDVCSNDWEAAARAWGG